MPDRPTTVSIGLCSDMVAALLQACCRAMVQVAMMRQHPRQLQPAGQVTYTLTTSQRCAGRCSAAWCSSWGGRCLERHCCWSSGVLSGLIFIGCLPLLACCHSCIAGQGTAPEKSAVLFLCTMYAGQLAAWHSCQSAGRAPSPCCGLANLVAPLMLFWAVQVIWRDCGLGWRGLPHQGSQ